MIRNWTQSAGRLQDGLEHCPFLRAAFTAYSFISLLFFTPAPALGSSSLAEIVPLSVTLGSGTTTFASDILCDCASSGTRFTVPPFFGADQVIGGQARLWISPGSGNEEASTLFLPGGDPAALESRDPLSLLRDDAVASRLMDFPGLERSTPSTGWPMTTWPRPMGSGMAACRMIT
jgi:hypothetical protein